jgi:hypothetical protein
MPHLNISGNPLYINAAQISAVFPQNNPEGGGQKTIVFAWSQLV